MQAPRYPISYDDAMRLAVEHGSAHMLAVARELRESGADAKLRPVGVEDVEVAACWHGVTVVRLPSGTQWWHPGSASWCEDVEPGPVGAQARVPMPVTTRDSASVGGETTRLDDRLRTPLGNAEATEVMGALRNCYHCQRTIAWDSVANVWRHVTSLQVVCATLADDETHVHAWPAVVDA